MPIPDKQECAVGKHVKIVRVEAPKAIASQDGSIWQQTSKTIAVCSSLFNDANVLAGNRQASGARPSRSVLAGDLVQ